MNQQRSRRFRSAQEAKEKEEEAAEFVKLLQDGGKEIHESLQNKKVWDSNAITPGILLLLKPQGFHSQKTNS